MTKTNGETNAAWGQGLSQDDLMERDTVLVLDNADNVVGSASKKDSHVFKAGQPHGILHRAFSVFLFDESDGRLLLHQRSSDKITFPDVWTNTCCSHPLHGMSPSEVDTPEDVRKGTVLGVKNAAVRKLQHELGIPDADASKMKFLTRLHYWAADSVTHGPKAPWGEHEIDYVLFWTVPSKDSITLAPNAEEIKDTRWVTNDELQAMLDDEKNLFSPWFRLIYQKWLKNLWWKDLKVTMTTDKWCDYETIHEFDPPVEHLGGGGDARPLFVTFDESKKQGAYGKIKTHTESKKQQLSHLDEVFSALQLLYITPLESNLESDFVKSTFNADDLAFCDEILVKVSRSFAAVIRQLPGVMLVDVLIFYLVLRALDTVEDDTSAFESNAVKVGHLKSFCQKALLEPNWTMHGVGSADERRLLEEFPKCQRIFAQLQPQSQEIIQDITQRMADGMAEFVAKDLGQGTTDIEQYNRYCHFVAGLVGEGLSRLFAASGLEKESFGKEIRLSDQMGLFLQKTNIIRDYLEDYVDKRAFWPQSVWKKYSETGDLGYFTNQSNKDVQVKSLQCLNELVTDALELVPDCLAYLSKLECVEIFRFCAIPQVMAIATLDKVFANPDVFTGVVKIRKGLSCKLILRTNNPAEVHETFYNFSNSIQRKLIAERNRGFSDPNFSRTLRACETIQNLTKQAAVRQRRVRTARWAVCVGPLVAASLLHYLPGAGSSRDAQGGKIVRSLLAVASSILYWYGPWTVKSNLTKANILRAKQRIQND